MKEVINVVILAAGKGTRLGSDCPKPLLGFQNVNLIHQVMNQACFFSNEYELKISVIVGHQKNEVMGPNIGFVFASLEADLFSTQP